MRLGHQPGPRWETWKEVAEELKKEFIKIFYDSEEGVFVRTVSGEKRDSAADSSLLGIAVPFGIIDPKDPRMAKTVEVLEKELLAASGLMRYSGDKYPREGGVWPLCTAWLSWYHSAAGNKQRAEECLELVSKCANRFGFLPEQVNKDFSPRWALPLAWSHAMYMIAADSLKQQPKNE
jgi:GH15 family glucan-1,4-alpha-glucosidase